MKRRSVAETTTRTSIKPVVWLLPALMLSATVLAAPRTWKSNTTGAWNDANNWVEGAVPAAGDEVYMTNAAAVAVLHTSTPALGSLTVSQTLIATNWSTVIRVAGDVNVQSGGAITTPVPDWNSTLTNRVYIECVNLILADGGWINVDAKGYGGGWANDGISTSQRAGKGPGASATRGSAGHGGFGGGLNNPTYLGGHTYGDPAAPLGPGSSGGSVDGRANRAGGHGGGAVRIDASGHVLVNGTITANGGKHATSGVASGSGGAIWISCATFAGTNGVIRANGADSTRGSGGGRIAVHYTPAAQQALPVPEVVFSTRGGTSTGANQGGDIGTLYFTDLSWIGPVVPHSGQLLCDNNPLEIAFDSLTVSNGWVRFPDGLVTLTVTHDLTVVEAGGRLEVGGSRYLPTREDITLGGWPWRLNNTSTQITTVAVGGNVILTRGGALGLIAAATNAVSGAYGCIMDVAGDVVIEAQSSLFPESNPTHGGSPRIVAGQLKIQAGGGIDASSRGFHGGWGGNGGSSTSRGGRGPGSAGFGAGGHGGKAGESIEQSVAYASGMTYGDPAAPLGPGSGGGSTDGRENRQGGHGGGSVLVQAGHVLVNGTINADGNPGGTVASASPGAGGAVWITCNTFAGTNGMIHADGKDFSRVGSGGGRIAIVYDTVAQDALPVPDVVFSVRGGRTTSGTPYIQHGDIGTLYFPDTRWVAGPVIPHTGQLLFGTNPSTLAYDTLTVSTGWIRFPDGLATITVTNNLTVTANGRLDVGGNDYYTARDGWRLNNTSAQATTLEVGGHLTLTNGGLMRLVPVATNAVGEGMIVNMGGDLTIESASWLYLQSVPDNGGSARMTCDNLLVCEGGGIDGVKGGFAGGSGSAGLGPGAARYGGGGYGGKGGAYSASYGGGPTYGNAASPLYAGSGGGSGNSRVERRGGYGGGRVRIEAANLFVLDGLIDVSGDTAGYEQSSGGSGGSIYVDCRHFSGSSNGVLRAAGGSGSYNGGGGGGGRIAICHGDLPTFEGNFNVDGGVGGYASGSNGTMTLVDVGPVITNHPAANTGFDKTWLVGELLSTGGAPSEVTVYWGLTDGATNKSAWDTNETFTAADLGMVSNYIYNLATESQYYYRYYATNALGSKWAPETSIFSTLGAPTVDNGIGPQEVERTSATLHGDVLTGEPLPLTFIAWGTLDGGNTTTGAWEQVIAMGENLGAFEAPLSGLAANQKIYYRCYVTNVFGHNWSPSTIHFTTLPPAMVVLDQSVTEGAASTTIDAVFTVNISEVSALDVAIDFTTVADTATAGSDYVATNGTLVIAAGATSGTITVEVLGDDVDEYPYERFKIKLSNPVNVVFDHAGDDEAICLIWDNDDTAETKIWHGTGNWTNAANWTPPGMPSPSDDVIIASGRVTLDSQAMILHPVGGFGNGTSVDIMSLIVSNAATLVMADWQTRLRVDGDVRIRDTATVTTPPTTTGSDITNRVHIVCANLTVSENAAIDVDDCGYGGGSGSAGRGPGGHWGAGSYGGKGGSGGHMYNYNYAGATYGLAEAPIGPGSGGGERDARADRVGGNGGGAVRIEATGHVQVDGTITANGGSGGSGATAGSGGAVWISCLTFSGSDGRIRADGQNKIYGSGGGRIAIVYDTSAQALVTPMPTVILSVRGGTSSTVDDQGDLGTVYLPDRALLDSPIRHSGQLIVPTQQNTIGYENLTVEDGWIRFSDGGFALTVENNLIVTGTHARLEVGGNRYANHLADQKWVYNQETACPTITVGGDLVLTNGAQLAIFAGATNAVVGKHGARLDIAGDLTMSDDAWLFPYSNPTNGGSVLITVDNLRIATTNSGINANRLGFAGGWGGWAYGPGAARSGGGGHGGRGGGRDATYTAQAPTYGSSNAPVIAGSGGGSVDSRADSNGGAGGGLVRIEALTTVEVNGTITANGDNTNQGGGGGGSGGAIFIQCRKFTGSNGNLLANGGNGGGFGGGGGGRIAVWYGERATDQTSIRQLIYPEDLPETFSGTFEVNGGPGAYQPGEAGTIRYVRVMSPLGTILMLR